MTKLEFMKELESLLPDIPLEEKEEALRYYNGYFDDAGEDQEEEIAKELGSPVKVAAYIKADLNLNATDRESRGYFTEKGYQETIKSEYEVVSKTNNETGDNGFYNQTGTNANGTNTNGTYSNANANKWAFDNSKTSTKKTDRVLYLLIAIITFPIWLPIMLSVFGIAIGIVASILGIIFGFGVAGIALIGAGLVLFIAGLVELSTPVIGLLMMGGGLIVLGIGMLFTTAVAIVCKKVLPVVVMGFVNLCRLPFKNRRVMA